MTARTTDRLDADRAFVARAMPRNTIETWNDSLETAIWYYRIDNELGTTFEFASFFDGALYQTAIIEPVGMEAELTSRAGAHAPHLFSNGFLCLGHGGGTQTLPECWAKTGMWAYHVAAFLRTGEWLFLNQ